ncbi:MAG: carboxylating nicotinate-nucleotide diphosphorylase [Planctomycetota bacterium]
MPYLGEYISQAELTALIETAKREDLGPDGEDITSACFIPEDQTGQAVFVSRESGYLSGLILLPIICDVYGGRVAAERLAMEGEVTYPGRKLAELQGPLRDILAIERVALNFISHMSGIATLTRNYCESFDGGYESTICDTRKTLPGLRGLQKYAVACGEGHTHRMGLYDAVLIKDNHIAGIPLDQLGQRLTEASQHVRNAWPNLKFIEVEVDTLDQLTEVLKAPIDLVLLDNMPNSDLKAAVDIRDKFAPYVKLEASGGVTLDTVRNIAKTGVDRISVGALTHSAASLDIGLDIG